MAGALTPKQIEFLETYVGIPKFFGRSKAKDLRAQYEVEFDRFNIRRDWVEGQIDTVADAEVAKLMKLELAKAEEIIMAGGKTPDFDGGHRHLVAVNQSVEAQRLIERVRAREAVVKVMVENALAAPSDKQDEIRMLWSYATENIAAGVKAVSIDKLNSALTAMDKLPGVIAAAVSLSAAIANAQGAQLVSEAKTVQAKALADLLAAEARLTNAEAAFKTGFDNSVPATLLQKVTEIRQLIDGAPKDDASVSGGDFEAEAKAIRDHADAVAKVAAQAVVKLNELDAAAKTPLEQFAQWKADRAAFEPKLATLNRHPGKAHPQVAPDVAAITNAFNIAKGKLTTWDYAGAIADLGPLPQKVDEAIKKADDYAKLQAVSQQRLDSVNSLRNPTALAHNQAKTAIQEAKDLYADAVREFNAGDVRKTMAALDKIPPSVDRATHLGNLSVEYTNGYASYGQTLTDCENKVKAINDVAIKGTLTTAIKKARDFWTANACGPDGDLTQAMQKLTSFYRATSTLTAQVADAEAYLAELKAFKERLKAVADRDADNGRIAIEEYYLRLQADETFARAKAASFDWAFASKVLKATEGKLQTEALALADLAKDFIARKKALNEQIVELRKKEHADKAETAIARVAELVASATDTAVTGKNWQGGLTTIAAAEKQAELAERLLTDAADIASAKDDAAHEGVGDAEAVEKAFANFQAVHGKVLGKDDGTFAAKLGTILQKATEAKAKAAGATPDFAAAAEGIKTALAEAEAVFAEIAAKRGYADRLAMVKGAHTGTLPGLSTDDCIKPEIDDIGTAITEAETLAKAPTLDFPGADAKLTAALAIMRKAEVNAAAYGRLKPNRDTIDTLLTYIEDPVRKDGVDEEIKRLKAIKKDIADAITARDFAKAEAKAKEGAGLDAGYRVIADDYKAAVDQRKSMITDQLHYLQGLPEVAGELAQVMALDASVVELMTARAYKAAKNVANNAANVIVKGYYINQDFQAWGPSKTAGETAHADVHARDSGGIAAITALVAKMDSEFQKAAKAAGERNYKTAKTWMDKVIATALLIEPHLVRMEDCRTQREEAEKAVADVGKLANQAAIEPLVARLGGKQANAIKLFDAGDFAAAKTLFTEIKADCQTAIDAAAKQAEYVTLNDEVKTLAGTDTQGVKDALAKAKTHVAELRAMPEGLYVIADVIAAETAIKAAEKALGEGSTDDTAKDKVVEAMDACARGRVNIGHYTQIVQSADYARQHIADFLSNHSAADFVKADMEALRGKVDETILALRGTPSKRGDAQTAIEEVMAEFHRLRGIADARKLYLPLRDKVSNDLLVMERDDGRYAIGDQIAAVKTKLQTADAASQARDHDRGMKLIEEARSEQLDALLKAKMSRGAVPPANEIKAILEGPNGVDRLDAIVESLDPVAQRSVLNAAFEARYGCKLNIFNNNAHEKQLEAWMKANPNASATQIETKRNQLRAANVSVDAGQKGPNIKRFYEVMDELPESATLENDSMIIFTTNEGPATGSDYNGGSKEVTMREGNASDSTYYGLTLPHELESVDAGCELDPGEEMTYFAWNTLHEVGHAVDDRASYMDRNGKTLAGWEYYGGNVLPAAKAIAGKLEFDPAYVAAIMSGDDNAAVPEPQGCEPEEWERRRAGVKVWVDRIRSGKDPWQTASGAKAAEVDGIVYQESYEGTWTSYPIAQRSKGVSGYQFRAPGEWFAELYAAYHSGKMKTSHPAYNWIKDL